MIKMYKEIMTRFDMYDDDEKLQTILQCFGIENVNDIHIYVHPKTHIITAEITSFEKS